jgi:hypothetical protein
VIAVVGWVLINQRMTSEQTADLLMSGGSALGTTALGLDALKFVKQLVADSATGESV